MTSTARAGGALGAALAVLLALAVQLTLGTLGGPESALRMDRPYHEDYWYYAGLARALLEDFPARNPAFAGEPLTQYSLHLLPLSMLSLVTSPYLAMRVLNLAYAVALVPILRRYFPQAYGWVALCLLATAPPLYENNPLSMDLLTRGFHHFPFFFLLLPALFERRIAWLRGAALFLLPWAHGLLALASAPGVLFAAWRSDRRQVLPFVAGFALAAAGVTLVSGGQGGGILLRTLELRPAEAIRHLLPLGVALAFRRDPTLVVLAAGAFALSSVVTWNRYYFLFPLDFALAVTAGVALGAGERRTRLVVGVAAALAFALWLYGGVKQFGPHRPFDRRPVAAALDWIAGNTPPASVWLVAPTPARLMMDDSFYRLRGGGYWVLEHRDLFVGFHGWAETVGLPGIDRSLRGDGYLAGREPVPPEVDYVFYGPQERAMYPGFTPQEAQRVYDDGIVTIFRIRGP